MIEYLGHMNRSRPSRGGRAALSAQGGASDRGNAHILLLLAIGGLVIAACGGTSAPIEAQPVEAAPQSAGGSPIDPRDPANSSGGDAAIPTEGGYIPQPGSSTPDLARSDAQGAVEFIVVPSAWTVDAAGTLEFEVSMNTHSVDLSMDLAALATLQTDAGETLQALDWSGGGGHHVIGVLRFPAGTPDGRALLQQARRLTLTIRELDAPARVFEWDVASLP